MGMLAIGGADGGAEELEKPNALTCCCDKPRSTRNVLGRRSILVKVEEVGDGRSEYATGIGGGARSELGPWDGGWQLRVGLINTIRNYTCKDRKLLNIKKSLNYKKYF
jgi:hypothetical protein